METKHVILTRTIQGLLTLWLWHFSNSMIPKFQSESGPPDSLLQIAWSDVHISASSQVTEAANLRTTIVNYCSAVQKLNFPMQIALDLSTSRVHFQLLLLLWVPMISQTATPYSVPELVILRNKQKKKSSGSSLSWYSRAGISQKASLLTLLTYNNFNLAWNCCKWNANLVHDYVCGLRQAPDFLLLNLNATKVPVHTKLHPPPQIVLRILGILCTQHHLEKKKGRAPPLYLKCISYLLWHYDDYLLYY